MTEKIFRGRQVIRKIIHETEMPVSRNFVGQKAIRLNMIEIDWHFSAIWFQFSLSYKIQLVCVDFCPQTNLPIEPTRPIMNTYLLEPIRESGPTNVV